MNSIHALPLTGNAGGDGHSSNSAVRRMSKPIIRTESARSALEQKFRRPSPHRIQGLVQRTQNGSGAGISEPSQIPGKEIMRGEAGTHADEGGTWKC